MTYRSIRTALILPLLLMLAMPAGAARASASPAADLRADSAMVRLPGHVLPALAKATAVAAKPGDSAEPITLTIVLKRDHQEAFDRYLHDIYDPHSKVFHHYLTQRQIAARFGPSRADYNSIMAYLRANGMKLIQGSKNRLTITVSGTWAQAEKAFGVRLADYRLNERTFYANDRDPWLPVVIGPHVQAVVGLSNLARPVRVRSTDIAERAHQLGEGDLAYTCYAAGAVDEADMGTLFAGLVSKGIGATTEISPISPITTVLRYMCAADELDLVAEYAGNASRGTPALAPKMAASTVPGTGQTIGLLEFDNYHPSDVQNFLNLVGQSGSFANLSEVDVAGGAGVPSSGESEVLLDIDAVMNLAPGAKVAVYDGPFNGRGSFQTMLNAMIGGGVSVISNSWAYCEDQTDLADVTSLNSVLSTAAGAGITVLSGSGDHGSTCLDGSANTLSVPADAPNITAVGGTSPTLNVGGTYSTETWWDGTNNLPPTGQGGFGTSRYFTRPPYQNALSSAAMRSIPDVTASADPAQGYLICQADAGGCPTNLLYGGTSVAAPIWAAAVALMNQSLGHNLGFLNTSIYPLANTPAFHSAADLGSAFAQVGLGSPNVAELKRMLAGQTAGAVNGANSGILAFPPVVQADGVNHAGIVAITLDNNFNIVSGQTVTLTPSSGSHATVTAVNAVTNTGNGAALFLVSDLVPETVTFTASYGGGNFSTTPSVNFVAPPAASGGIGANPTTVTADGSSTATITVTLKDAANNPSPGKVVGLSQGNGASQISATTSATDTSGTVRFTATNLIAQSVIYTAIDITDGNLPVPGSASVDYTNPSGAPPCNVGLGTASAGFAVSTFASGFVYSTGCIGPIGLAFDGQGNLLVGNDTTVVLYKFGPQGGIADPGHEVGAPKLSSLLGLTFTSDARLYAADSVGAQIVELDPSTGAVLGGVVAFLPAIALTVDPLSGDLFSSLIGAACFDSGIWSISNFAGGSGMTNTYSDPGNCTFFDGLNFGPDGTLYAAGAEHAPGVIFSVTGTNSATPGTATQIATVPTGDGIALSPNSADPSHPFVYVNANNGTITKVDTTTSPATLTQIYTGGSRGDFVTVGPDGCMYATQTDRVIKITNADGTCSFAPQTVTPEILLTPQSVTPSPAQGSSVNFTATLQNAANLNGVPITLTVNGANPNAYSATTDSSGVATFNYTGVVTGSDLVTALTIPAGGSPLLSNSTGVTWTAGLHSTFLSLNETPISGVVNSPITLVGTLVDFSVTPPTALVGSALHFTLGGQACSGITDSAGTASCSVSLSVPAGSYPVVGSYAGSSAMLPTSNTRLVNLLAAMSSTPTMTPTPTATPTATGSATPVATPTSTATATPSATPTPSSACLESSAAALEFPARAAARGRVTRNFRISNSCETTVTGYVTPLNDTAFFVIRGGGNFSLGAGESRKIVVAFRPPQTGDFQSNVLIVGEQPSYQQVIVDLSGTGTPRPK